MFSDEHPCQRNACVPPLGRHLFLSVLKKVVIFVEPVLCGKRIQELLDNGFISEVIDRPEFINPLYVASQSSGKKRLILDLSHLNNYVVKTSVKYEDLKTVIQLLKSDYVFSFDIKSGYHHIGIFEEHRKYLSFCWQFEDGTIRYFYFNVLPSGLLPTPYVFTEVMCQVTKY